MVQSFWTGAQAAETSDLESLFSGKRSFFRKRVDGQRKFLKDPYTGRPVCVLDEETAKKLGISTEKGGSADSHHSIGGAHGLLRAVTVSELYLRKDGQEKKIADVTVAAGPGRLSRSGGYQMILHPALLEERKEQTMILKVAMPGKVQFKLIRREPAFLWHMRGIFIILAAQMCFRHLWKRNRENEVIQDLATEEYAQEAVNFN